MSVICVGVCVKFLKAIISLHLCLFYDGVCGVYTDLLNLFG